jgi:hypothetical protein
VTLDRRSFLLALAAIPFAAVPSFAVAPARRRWIASAVLQQRSTIGNYETSWEDDDWYPIDIIKPSRLTVSLRDGDETYEASGIIDTEGELLSKAVFLVGIVLQDAAPADRFAAGDAMGRAIMAALQSGPVRVYGSSHEPHDVEVLA